MDANKLTLTIKSAELGRKHVGFGDFLFQLDALKQVLSSTESFVSGKKAVINWQIVNLSHSSPTQIVLQPVDTQPELADMTVEKIFDCFKVFSGEKRPWFPLSREVVESYKGFSNKIREGVLKVNLRSGTYAVEVDDYVKSEEFSVVFSTILPETKAIGVVEGRLEYVNIHGTQNLFRIYPSIGPKRVDCLFPSDKIEEAREALNRRVRVSGELMYPEGSDFPKTVKVESIELLPVDDELPSLMDLRGIAPDLTDDLSSEEFVRSLRNAE